jgi:hypothetical protein
MFNSEQLQKKWAPILEAKDAPVFKDNYRKAITAVLLENQEKALREENAQASFLNEGNTIGGSDIGGGTGAVKTWDPVLISLVRRAMPNIVAYDIAGVQPMTMPTGLIFAMRSQYQNAAGTNQAEALFNKPDVGFSGQQGTTATGAFGLTTAQGEGLSGSGLNARYIDPNVALGLGTSGATYGTATGAPATDLNGTSSVNIGRTNGGFGQMGFTVDKTTVTAQTRALKAEYTMELAQDLKAVHGLDAEAELANILSVEILAEINREVIETVNAKAIVGGIRGVTLVGASGAGGVATVGNPTGLFDINEDADGRWAVEKFKSLLFQIEIEANSVAKATRRGKGNIVICSSNVASALAAAGVLDYAPALATNLNVDDTGNVFAGVLNGRMKVFIDPFADNDYITVGYRGANAYDAGIFYCPYVPLTMVRAVDPNTFQPKIGFKTRYGLVANPFAGGASASATGTNGQNPYFRRFVVTGLGGGSYIPTEQAAS